MESLRRQLFTPKLTPNKEDVPKDDPNKEDVPKKDPNQEDVPPAIILNQLDNKYKSALKSGATIEEIEKIKEEIKNVILTEINKSDKDNNEKNINLMDIYAFYFPYNIPYDLSSKGRESNQEYKYLQNKF